MRTPTFAQQVGLRFSKSSNTSSSVPRGRLAGTGVEVPSHSFPAPLPSKQALTQSDRASGEAFAPSKPSVPHVSSAGSTLWVGRIERGFGVLQ